MSATQRIYVAIAVRPKNDTEIDTTRNISKRNVRGQKLILSMRLCANTVTIWSIVKKFSNEDENENEDSVQNKRNKKMPQKLPNRLLRAASQNDKVLSQTQEDLPQTANSLSKPVAGKPSNPIAVNTPVRSDPLPNDLTPQDKELLMKLIKHNIEVILNKTTLLPHQLAILSTASREVVRLRMNKQNVKSARDIIFSIIKEEV